MQRDPKPAILLSNHHYVFILSPSTPSPSLTSRTYSIALPVAASEFPGGETDQRFKKQQYLDLDGICQVRCAVSKMCLHPPPTYFNLHFIRILVDTQGGYHILIPPSLPSSLLALLLSPVLSSQVGEVLEPNHVIVNKYSPINQTDLGDGGYSPNKQEYKHTKMSYKGTAPSTVDKVMITSNENENFIIKVSALPYDLSLV